MRIIGRLAMPLYAFGIAEGFIHTSSRKKYFCRLLIFAAIAEIPYVLLDIVDERHLYFNILFSFALSIPALWLVEKGKFYWLGVIPILLIAEFGRIEYGWIVPALVIIFYLCRKHLYKKYREAYYIAMLIGITLMQIAFALPNKQYIQLYAILAFIPLLFYNGKKGQRLPKYAGYIFYPAHLFVILCIRLLLN